jgi:hypothetical protein
MTKNDAQITSMINAETKKDSVNNDGDPTPGLNAHNRNLARRNIRTALLLALIAIASLLGFMNKIGILG